MKVIDKTLYQDDKGEIGIIGRIQGTVKYGFDWYAEMEAQQIVVTQLNRALEKGFVLIRNFNLPGSKIIIPLILIGTGGIHIIHTTPAKGRFEAKGDQWNVVDGSGNTQLARVNLLDKAVKLTRAFNKYLEISKIKITAPIETVLIAVNPGAHVETSRPVIKVIKSDVIKNFIAMLTQTPPVWRTDYIYQLADRISEPRLQDSKSEPEPEPVAPVQASQSFSDFDDSKTAQPFDASDFRGGFAEPVAEQQPAPQSIPVEKPQQKARPRPAPAKKIFGMTRGQFFVIVGIIVFWLCIMAVLGVLFLFYPPQ